MAFITKIFCHWKATIRVSVGSQEGMNPVDDFYASAHPVDGTGGIVLWGCPSICECIYTVSPQNVHLFIFG